jgi:hypothetical protein
MPHDWIPYLFLSDLNFFASHAIQGVWQAKSNENEQKNLSNVQKSHNQIGGRKVAWHQWTADGP